VATLHLPRGDGEHHLRQTLVSVFWAVCAAAVMLALVLGAILDVQPSDAEAATAAVLLAAALWLAHEWRLQWRQERRR